MLPDITREEFDAALRVLVEETLAAANIAAPPVSALEVAAALGLAVLRGKEQAGRAQIMRLAGSAVDTIVVRPEPRDERVHWAVAHEIGEHLAAQVFGR